MRYVGFGTETTFRTKATPDRFYNLVRSTVNPSREALIFGGVAYRAALDVLPGPIRATGDLEGLLSANLMSRIQYYLCGQATKTPDDAAAPKAYKYESTPIETGTLPTFSLEIGTEDPDALWVLGSAINTLTLEANAGEILALTVGVIGAKPEVAAKTATVTLTAESPITFVKASLSRGGTDISGKVRTFSITVTNNIPDDAFVIGDQYLAKILIQRLEVEGELEIEFDSWDEYATFIGASSFALKLEATGPSTPSTVAGFENEKVTIEVPKCYYTAHEMNVEEKARLVARLTFRGVHDGTAGYAIKFTTINTLTSA